MTNHFKKDRQTSTIINSSQLMRYLTFLSNKKYGPTDQRTPLIEGIKKGKSPKTKV